MRKIWERIKLELLRLWQSTWWAFISIWVAAVAGLIFGWHIAPWVFFAGIITMILYVWLRQIWWFIAGKQDFEGRNGFLKRFGNKIFKK